MPRAQVDRHDPEAGAPDDESRPPASPWAAHLKNERPLKSDRGHISRLAREADDTPVVVRGTPANGNSLADVIRGEGVALKVLRRRGAIGVDDVVVASGYVWTKRRYVEGITLAERLESGPLPLDQAMRVATAVLRALEAAHEAGVMHGDLHPANIILDDEPVVRHVRLVDFGMGRGRIRRATQQHPPALARYAAPERAGLIDHEVGEPADLYSLGAVLHEALSGVPLFDGDDLGAVLRAQLNQRPPALRALGIDVPHAVDAFLQRLLEKDPRRRYQSATGALADARQLAAAVAQDQEPVDVVIGRHDRRTTLTEPAFVGRESAAEALMEHLRRVRRGHPEIVYVEAESGGGKTRLLTEFAQRAALQGAWVISGQGTDQAALRPLQMLEGVARSVRELANRDEEARRRLEARIGDQIDSLVEAFPPLADAFGRRRPPAVGPEIFGADRTQAALMRLLDALGSADRPAVLLLDDVQWADDHLYNLLAAWGAHHETRSPGDTPLLVVAAFRSDEVDQHHPLRKRAPNRTITLAPMSEEDIRNMAASMAGALPEQATQFIIQLADGNPFMASAILRGLVEARALTATADGWNIDAAHLDEARRSRDVGQFLANRLAHLPAPVRTLLRSAAVLGKSFDVAQVAALADMEHASALQALAVARRRRLVWTVGEEGQYAFAHDKIRQTVLDQLNTAARRSMHERAAQILEASARASPFELAYHLDAAGQHRRSFEPAVRAAEEARARFGLEVAERYYLIALRGAAGRPDSDRLPVSVGLAEVLMLRGRYDAAGTRFSEARELAGNDESQKARIDVRIGELEFKRGNVAKAAAAQERALRGMGHRVPRTRVGYAFALLFELAVQTLHTWFPGLTGRRSAASAEADLRAARSFSRLAYANWFLRGVVPTMWAHLRGMNLTERYPPSEEMAQAYSEHAPAMTTIPLFRRGERYARRSLEIRQEARHSWGQGQSLHFLGLVQYAAGDFENALVNSKEAERILDHTGDRWESLNAGFHTAMALHRMGRLREAAEKARAIFEAGDAIGDVQAMGFAAEVWAKATDGRLPAVVIERGLERIPDEDAQTMEAILQGKAILEMAEGDPLRAANTLGEAHRRAKAGGLRSEYVASIPAWETTALRTAAENLPAWARSERARLLRRARRASRRATAFARRFPNNQPHVYRERAALAALLGRNRTARRWLARSIDVATRQGAAYEGALTSDLRARMGATFGWPEPTEGPDEAAQMLHALRGGNVPLGGLGPIDASLSLADRFHSVLTVGRELASALSADEVRTAVRSAGLSLLRGESCTVVPVVEEQGVLVPRPGPDDPVLPRALFDMVRARSEPVVWRPEPDQRTTLDPVCAALAAPIFAGDRLAAVLYTTHSQVEHVFGTDEEQLARFITALAGASFEAVEAYGELRETHQRLHFQTTVLQSQSEAAPDGILVVGPDGDILSYNKRFLEMWGIPDQVAIARDDDQALASVLGQLVDPDGFLDKVRYLYAHPEQRSRDEIKLKDGRVFDRYSGPVVDRENVFHGRVWFFRDITQTRRGEEELRAAYDRLKEVDQLKTRFINMAAHELNTPLTPIQIQLHMLGERDTERFTPSQRRAVAILQKNMRRLGELVHDLLDASRLQSGRVDVHPESVDLAELVREAAEPYEDHARSRQVTVHYALEEECTLQTDPRLLAQCVHNLVSNAIKYTPAGGHVHVQTRSRQDQVIIEVRDDGVGLSVDQMTRLFKPFSKVQDRAPDSQPGTGLGLFITQGTTERLGGRVEVASDGPGTGATFRLILPMEVPRAALESGAPFLGAMDAASTDPSMPPLETTKEARP